MMLVRVLSILFVTMSLIACSIQAPPIKDHASIEVPDGKNTKTLGLIKIKSKVAKGAVIGYIGEGWGCMAVNKMQWRAGKGNIADEEMHSAFVEELRRFNYNVVGDPDDLFDNKAGRAELAVAGLITNITWNVCFHNGYLDGWSKGSTYVELEIEWQLYNTLDKQTILKCRTTGQAKVEFANRQIDEGFRGAIAHATQGLLADKNFYNLVLEKENSGPMGGLTDGAQLTPNVSAAVASPGKAGTVPAKGKVATLADAQARVVVIQMPGGGHGSGFLIGQNGYILTNQHVANDSKKLRIIYQDGTKAEATVLRTDARQDVALLQVDAPQVSGLDARMEDLPVGTDVFSIGAPREMGLHGTVSKGVVSSYRRNERGRWLQSDAKVNHGSSGGPLVDAHGRVVGICSWGFTGEDSDGLKFFVPIADAFRVMGI